VRRRSYRLGKRAGTVAKTRARILDAARRMLMRADFRRLALEEVARLAGVTRVTVYNQFGTKVGLIEALFRDTGQRMGLERVLGALALPDPRAALDALIREHCRAWSRERVVLQRLVALAAVDPDAGAVLAYLEGRRTHDARVLVARLGASRMLARGVLEREATAAIVGLTTFQLYDQLIASTSTTERAIAAIQRMVSGFLAPPPARAK
jgi:AcrR family transcriptional regulator